MKAALLLALLTLAACGADAPPFVPQADLGTGIGPDGIAPQASGTATTGTITVGVTL